eukprot:PhM_4_TR8066/c0_g1_i2/m.80415
MTKLLSSLALELRRGMTEDLLGVDEEFWDDVEYAAQEDTVTLQGWGALVVLLHKLTFASNRDEWEAYVDFRRELLNLVDIVLQGETLTDKAHRRLSEFADKTLLAAIIDEFVAENGELAGARDIISSLVHADVMVWVGFGTNGNDASRAHVASLVRNIRQNNIASVLLGHSDALRRALMMASRTEKRITDINYMLGFGDFRIRRIVVDVLCGASHDQSEAICDLFVGDNSAQKCTWALRTLLRAAVPTRSQDAFDCPMQTLLVYVLSNDVRSTRSLMEEVVMDMNDHTVLWVLASLSATFPTVKTMLEKLPLTSLAAFQRAQWAVSLIAGTDPRRNREVDADNLREDVKSYLREFQDHRRGDGDSKVLASSTRMSLLSPRKDSTSSEESGKSDIVKTDRAHEPIVLLGVERHIARMERAVKEREFEMVRERALREKRTKQKLEKQREMRREREYMRQRSRKEEILRIAQRREKKQRTLREARARLHLEWSEAMNADAAGAPQNNAGDEPKPKVASVQRLRILSEPKHSKRADSVPLRSASMRASCNSETPQPSIKLTKEQQEAMANRLARRVWTPPPEATAPRQFVRDLEDYANRLYYNPRQQKVGRQEEATRKMYPPWAPQWQEPALPPEVVDECTTRLHMTSQQHKEKERQAERAVESRRVKPNLPEVRKHV